MTVTELIEQLKAIDGARIVVMSKDEEGNGYSPLSSLWQCSYEDGQVGFEDLTEDDIERGYTEEDVLEGKPAVCLYPGWD